MWLGRALEHLVGQEGCSPLRERCVLYIGQGAGGDEEGTGEQ